MTPPRPVYVVSGVAGGGSAGGIATGARNGVGSAALFLHPKGASVDVAAGLLYIADTGNNLIRSITLASGVVETLAGGGAANGTTAGRAEGTGSAATFNQPAGVNFDEVSGCVYVVDTNNNLIRVVTAAGVTSTLAGGGSALGNATGAANGVGSAATFKSPRGAAISASGSVLYITDYSNNLVRAIAIPGATVTTYAGGGSAGGTALGHADGAGSAATFSFPLGIAIDLAGTLYVTDSHLIRTIAATSATVTTLAGGGSAGGTVLGHANGVGSAATFSYPSALVAINSTGILYVADGANNLLRAIELSSALVRTVAGGNGGISLGHANGAGTMATFSNLAGVTADRSGMMYISEYNNALVRAMTIPF